MNKYNTTEEFLLYITDCTLATVSHMALLKSRKKGEFSRQISIAQKAIDWIKYKSIPVRVDSRVYDVLNTDSQTVQEWADKFTV